LTPILGTIASSYSISGSFVSIASASGTGSSQSITFSDIPQTYKHLQIRGIGQAPGYANNDEGSVGIRINGDTSGNYTRAQFSANGSTLGSSILISTTFAETGSGAFLNSGNTVASSIIDILNYTSNTFKSIRGIGGCDRNGGGSLVSASGLWRNTAAITSITVFQQNANFGTKSFYALYGIE
jgi:hypothetical protein